MSDLRIALIAEGPTDRILIEAALSAIIPTPFVLTLIQPEQTLDQVGGIGGGWGGVCEWCHRSVLRGKGVLEDDPTLLYDLFIVHLDADVAGMRYSDCRPPKDAVAQDNQWGQLPCALPCPSPQDSVTPLRTVLLSWLGNIAPGQRTIICIPSKAVESWLAAAVLPVGAPLLNNIECNLNMENGLKILSKDLRIKKGRTEYLKHARTVQQQWERVRELCVQAEIFHHDVVSAFQNLAANQP
ncbi:MAG: hypothetical protein WCC61_02505 [Pseudomonas sp.]|jgi:hypothetical protein|uniref:hypothetical protein n=1 Tax=Pseudomonas sp. TaxID=306 RepID=UPI003C7B8912